MDLIASPLITILANVIADLLVSKGIVDVSSKTATIQSINNAMAAAMTLGVAIVSIVKMVELQKHKLSLIHGKPMETKTETITTISQPVSQQLTPDPNGQSGKQNIAAEMPLPQIPTI